MHAAVAGDQAARQRQGTVLVVEDDRAIAAVVQTLLEDEGYATAVVGTMTPDAIRSAVGRLEPDCILLDSARNGDYAPSWPEAVWAHTRSRPVPVVMFTAGAAAAREAEARQSDRSRAIYAVLAKPFDIDALLDTVARAVGSVARFDRSEDAERGRTAALVARLEAAGATDVRSSTRREWANFYAGDALSILYWSQRDGAYYVLRQPQDTGAVREIGRSYDLDAAVALAVSVPPSG